MVDWPRWTSRRLLCFLSCTQSIIPLITGVPTEPRPASAAIARSVYGAIHDAEQDAVPEGYSLVQTIQTGYCAVWRPHLVPAFIDYGSYEYQPGKLVTNQLVANANQAPSHTRDNFVLREQARPFEPSHSKNDQGCLSNQQPHKKKEPKRISGSASGASSSEHSEKFKEESVATSPTKIKQDRLDKQPKPNLSAQEKNQQPNLLKNVNHEENSSQMTSAIESNNSGDNHPIDEGKNLRPEDVNLAGVKSDSTPRHSNPSSESYKHVLLNAIDDSNTAGKAERMKKQTKAMNVALHSMDTRGPKLISKKHPSSPSKGSLRILTNRNSDTTKNQKQSFNVNSAAPDKKGKSSDGKVDHGVDRFSWKKAKDVVKA
ncbi:hypothetical protein PCASD_15206 [Puccinia coronata f. sp. avenae]|uniref:Uncharacterized protein n=1 Tax=Puccinia coronata f. sp. avenae TaxID=200324 RepID=A0A2N5U0K1_9BASI|nr:hypothetical protein PCASD_15206 [Puccinia coronata f. sp. avenae]